jgi:hypothetical protein
MAIRFSGEKPALAKAIINAENRVMQILWFVGLWAFGVLSLGFIGLVIKFVL